MLVFDIETAPLPDEILLQIMPPFDESKLKRPADKFDPSSVKVGNLKDKDKIAEKVAAARMEHAQAVKEFDSVLEQARETYAADFKAKAALSPLSGYVVAIGFKDAEHCRGMYSPDNSEREMIQQFFDFWEELDFTGAFVGHNIHQFDLPFIVRRAWRLGLDVPAEFRTGRYWNNRFVDTMQVWACGAPMQYVKLDDLCRFFGIPGKPEEVTGETFHQFLHGTADQRKLAIDYHLNDLEMTYAVASQMQIV